MVYRLANGKILDERGLYIAMIDDNIFSHYFLDIATGKVKLVSEEFDIEPDDIFKKIRDKQVKEMGSAAIYDVVN